MSALDGLSSRNVAKSVNPYFAFGSNKGARRRGRGEVQYSSSGTRQNKAKLQGLAVCVSLVLGGYFQQSHMVSKISN